MFTISKKFSFSASHQLKGLPEGHQCARLHGHNYEVEIILRSDVLDEVGFVRDYGELSNFKDFIDRNLDHRHLNDVFFFNPTAELLAKELFDISKSFYPEVFAIVVKETDKTSARYEADDES